MMKNYEKPCAMVVSFEATDIITFSVLDFPDLLNTWGSNIQNVSAKDINLYE